MSYLQANHIGSSALPLLFIHGPLPPKTARLTEFRVRKRIVVKAVSSGPMSSAEMNGREMEEEKKSEVYSENMTQAMGSVLTYRHELGMNYNFILPDLIVGSCLQSPEDVDKLRSIGVKTIFCLQQNSDLEYFDVDINAIQDYCKQCSDIEHVRAEIRDFDGFDLRMRLPSVISKLHKVINCNGGVTYIHCTAGLGRAPSVALAYMFWVLGYKLGEANNLLQGKRSCFPNSEAINYATQDILTGLGKRLVTLNWQDDHCSSVEVSGLDVGWTQRIPLQFDEDKGAWILKRELPEGRYEYKYIVDGEWMCNKNELMTDPNNHGYINNYIHVAGIDSSTNESRGPLPDDYDLTANERIKIKQFLESYADGNILDDDGLF